MKTIRIAALTTLFAGAIAAAQTEADPAAESCPPDQAAVPAPAPALPLPVDPGNAGRRPKDVPKHVYTRVGMAAVLGGGVTQYFNSTANDRLEVGPSWTARLEVGTRSYLAGEFGYVGSSQQLKTLGNRDAVMLTNGAEGLLRVNMLTGPIQPYAGVGIGWKNYQLRNANVGLSDITPSSDIAHVPAITGIAFRAKGLVLDARFSVDGLISPNLIANSTIVSWDASGRVGFEF